MDRQSSAVNINQRKLQRLQNQASTIIEEGSIREQSNLQGEVLDPPALSLTPQRSRTGGNAPSIYPPQERTINELSYIPKVSKWRKFINLLGCCNICVKSSEAEPYSEGYNNKSQSIRNKQEHSKSLFISFRSNNNNPNPLDNQTENSSSFLDLPSRQPSNSSLWLYNVLKYSSSGYCALKFGNFNFLQIPVRFERIRTKPKMTPYQNISQDLQNKDNSQFTLVIQEYFDSELSLDLSSNSAYTLCVFANIATSIDPNLNESTTSNLANSDGLKSTPAQSLSSHQEQYFYQQIQAIIPKKQLSKIDFLRCHDLSVTVQQEQFDKIYIIPTSLKQQGNAFNDDFTMHQEFKRRFQELLNEYVNVLYKTTFLLPKYCRIREIMLIIYECFKNSDLSLGELNFGIQFHSYINTHQDVDAIALVFDSSQNVDTLAAISHRVFSNIFPEKSNPKIKDSKNSQKEVPGKKESDGSLLLYPHSNSKDEDSHANRALINQTEQDFGKEEYIEEMCKCTFKQFFGFLKDINACFIVYEDNTFQYRTHIIDSMLKHQLISRSFVQYLLTNIENLDESSSLQTSQAASSIQQGKKQSIPSISSTKYSQDKLSNSSLSKSKDKAATANLSTFKEYFMKNSSQYTNGLSISSKAKLNIVFEGAASYSEPSDLASRNTSDYEHLQANFRKISKPLGNYSRSPVEQRSNNLEKSNTSQDQNENSQVYCSEQQEQMPSSSNGISVSQQISHEKILNRTKQISCNCFSTSTNNKHIGFKSKKRLSYSNIYADPDILSHTTASRIADKSSENLVFNSQKVQGKKDGI